MDAKQSLGEPRALISREALVHNLRLIRQTLSPGTKICAVVKADAYGHGAGIVVETLAHDAGADVDALAVASIDEAAALPATSLPVLIFRPVENAFVGRQRRKIEQAIRSGRTLTLCSSAAADDVARIALRLKHRGRVQVMVDTGMARSGVDPDDLEHLLSKVASHPSLRLDGLCTHFACAEERENPLTARQLECFDRMTRDAANTMRPRALIRHAANSAAVFFLPRSHLDMVRPGIGLYGIDPTGRPSIDRKLRPVMKWTAPLIGVRELSGGDGVGYGQTWTASRDARIGLVPVGYADGYLRCFSNRAVMIVHGRPAAVVGRVSMDFTTIDLTDVPQARVGDDVTILDDDPLSPASVYHLARLADTIPYEIFCRIGQRIARVAIGTVDPAGTAPQTHADAHG